MLGEEKDRREISTQNGVSADSREVGANVVVSSKSKRGWWYRRVSFVLMGIVAFVLILPLVVYLPPVQKMLKNIACEIAADATGLNISIDKFSLKFPLDVSLGDVVVVESSGDTMLRAHEVVIDVKILPLFDMEIVPEKLHLRSCQYRMLSSDSSMLLRAKVDYVKVGVMSKVSLENSRIEVGDAIVRGGDVSLSINLWKSKSEPTDTATPKWIVDAKRVDLEDVKFAMSMLPTIDTLQVSIKKTTLRNGLVDLVSNRITAESLASSGGDFCYLTPPSDYKMPSPLPQDTVDSVSRPMIIEVDSISFDDYKGIYAMRGVVPSKGLDASYLSVSGVGLNVGGLHIDGSDITMSLRSLRGVERCGLEVVDAYGDVRLTDSGIEADGFRLETKHSSLSIDAEVSQALMSMNYDAPFRMVANANIGFKDLYSVMPMLQSATTGIPTHNPLTIDVNVDGSLRKVDVEKININMRDYLTLQAHGEVCNPMDIDKASGYIDMRGGLNNTSLVNRIVYAHGIEVPPLTIDGVVEIGAGNYIADVALTTEKGCVVLDGELSLNSEKYRAEIMVDSLQMRSIMPVLKLGTITADLTAEGSGFNIEDTQSWSMINLGIKNVEYRGHEYGEMELSASLENGEFEVDATCYDPYADVDLSARGMINAGVYEADLDLVVNHMDMHQLGLTDSQNAGRVNIAMQCNAEPSKNIYDVDLKISDVGWSLPGRYIYLPDGMSVSFDSGIKNVNMAMRAPNMRAAFDSPYGLDSLINRVTMASDTLMHQVSRHNVSIEDLRHYLPNFEVTLNAAGKGFVGQMLGMAGVSLDSLDLRLRKDDNISVAGVAKRVSVASINLDTVMIQMKDRGRLLDYRVHVGNKKGTLDEFAQIDVRGYVGGSRASVSLTQRNIEGRTGYRLGLTTALQDSMLSVHFTPLNATIGYLPWIFNEDNHIDYSLSTSHIDANLEAVSNDSHIRLKSVADEKGDALNVSLANIHIEDFLKLYAFAPPIKGALNSDMTLVFREKGIGGKGLLSVADLTYERQRIGDFDFDFAAGMGTEGKSGARLSLLIDKQKVLSGYGVVNAQDTVSGNKTRMGLELTEFPLKLVNAFLGKDVASLAGSIDGDMTMEGSLVAPRLNGSIRFSDASVYLPIMGGSLRLDSVAVPVQDNVIIFDNFKVRAANANPLVVDGLIDAHDFADLGVNLNLSAKELQVINNDKRAKSDIYGKLFMSLTASAKGRLSSLDIAAKASILPATDVYYTLPNAEVVLTEQTSGEVVKFVQLTDTTKVETDSLKRSMMMRINASLDIVNGAKATVNLSSNGADRVQILPSGMLNYSQSFMGDTRLNGQLNIGGGTVRYTPPIMGEKMFEIEPNSYVLWNGEMMNPILNIKAINKMKATVNQDGQNSRLVDFDISLSVTNTLSNIGILFDVSTEDDATVQNQLKTMSEDQRSTQAMNMLITNTYSGNVAASAAALGENALYSFLTSKLNSWAASNIRGVDLSFGIDQYDKRVDGRSSSTMSYSYQVSKSLFDNKFKIVVGGNYTTDASADENFAQNLISDISFEYTLKQTSTMNMYIKLFRHSDFESILEGEITETGAGFVLKHRVLNFYHLFRHKKTPKASEGVVDTLKNDLKSVKKEVITVTPDSIFGDEIPESEGYDELN